MPASRTCWLARKNHAIALGPVADCELSTTRSIARLPTRTIVPAGAATNRTSPTRDRRPSGAQVSTLAPMFSWESFNLFLTRRCGFPAASVSQIRPAGAALRARGQSSARKRLVQESLCTRCRRPGGKVQQCGKSTVGLAWAHVQCCLRYHC